jgi:hypothetical protein
MEFRERQSAMRKYWKWENRHYNGGWLWFSKSKCQDKMKYYDNLLSKKPDPNIKYELETENDFHDATTATDEYYEDSEKLSRMTSEQAYLVKSGFREGYIYSKSHESDEAIKLLSELHNATCYRLSGDDMRVDRPSAELFDKVNNFIYSLKQPAPKVLCNCDVGTSGWCPKHHMGTE